MWSWTSRTDANGVETSFTMTSTAICSPRRSTVTDIDGVEHDYVVDNTYSPRASFDPPHIKNRVASHTDRNGAVTDLRVRPRRAADIVRDHGDGCGRIDLRCSGRATVTTRSTAID